MQRYKLEYQKLNDRIYASIRAGLISGVYQPGEILVIRTVAQTYGISPTPVREALQRLVAERLLAMKDNRSIIVPPLSVEKFGELYRIRCALEGLAGELATEHLNSVDLARLKKTIKLMDGAMAKWDGAAYRRLNEKFHFAIYEKANAPHLLEMIQNLWCQAGPFMYGLFEDGNYGRHANDYHRQILRALEKKDGLQVREKIAADIATAAHSLIPQLKSLVVHEPSRAAKDVPSGRPKRRAKVHSYAAIT